MNNYELLRPIGQGAFGKALLVRARGDGGGVCVVKEVNLRKVREEKRRAGQGRLKEGLKTRFKNNSSYSRSLPWISCVGIGERSC